MYCMAKKLLYIGKKWCFFVFVGNPPKEASFSMHSLLMCHYLSGAWYPKGGASQIAYNMIPIIEKAGGAVLVRAPVNRILLNAASEAIGNIKKGPKLSQALKS